MTSQMTLRMIAVRSVSFLKGTRAARFADAMRNVSGIRLDAGAGRAGSSGHHGLKA